MPEFLVPPIGGWTYLYGRNAGSSVSSRIVAALTMHLNPVLLSDALQEAAVRFPQMCVRLAVRDGRKVFEPLAAPVPLFVYGEGPCDFSDETLGGYLFKVSYIHKTVCFDFHRALSDEYGMMSFAKAVLFRYLELSGFGVGNDGSVKLLSGSYFMAEGEDPMARMEELNASRPVWYMDAKAVVPELYGKGEEQVVKVIIPLNEAMKMSSGSCVNAVSYISPALSESVREVYAGDIGPGEYVVAAVSVNLRPYFPSASLRPFNTGIYLAYNRSLSEYPYNTVQMSQKKLMEAQMKNDALAYSAQRHVGDLEAAMESAGSLGSADEAMSRLQERTASRFTYSIGGIGNVILPEGMRRLVPEFYAVVPSGGRTCSVTVEYYSGSLVVAICGREKAMAAGRRFVELLHENDMAAFIADSYSFVPMDMSN